ncbi:MAG: hypothetical protein ACRBFS_02120 [Aureispira sp.]
MKRQTIEAPSLKTLDWFENKVVDWNSAGKQYTIDGEPEQLHKYHFGFDCDGSITSEKGEYVLIYQKLGTKGLLLKNGELLREINRSYYQSSVYEFPAAFLEYKNRTYLVHCPIEYCRLDIEDVETGEIMTNKVERAPVDVFHSRLEISPDNKFILSKGWYWHPWDGIELFDVEACLANPRLLDEGVSPPDVGTEISSASFINKEEIVVYATMEESMGEVGAEPIPPGHLAIWNIPTNTIKNAVKVQGNCGNIFAIDNKKCWDVFDYPKQISLETGEIIHKEESIFSGRQASSIIHHLDPLPKIAYNRQTKQIAIAYEHKIEILSE